MCSDPLRHHSMIDVEMMMVMMPYRWQLGFRGLDFALTPFPPASAPSPAPTTTTTPTSLSREIASLAPPLAALRCSCLGHPPFTINQKRTFGKCHRAVSVIDLDHQVLSL